MARCRDGMAASGCGCTKGQVGAGANPASASAERRRQAGRVWGIKANTGIQRGAVRMVSAATLAVTGTAHSAHGASH